MATVNEFQERVKNFLDNMGWGSKDKENKYYGLIHLMEELGEFSRELLYAESDRNKFNWKGDGHSSDKLSEELADLFYHCFRMAVLFDIDLEDVFLKKMSVIEERYLKMK